MLFPLYAAPERKENRQTCLFLSIFADLSAASLSVF
jgi:hypothetical protein